MNYFRPVQKKLWHNVSAKLDEFDIDKFAVRKALITAYVACGGDFTIIDTKTNEVNASLLTTSATHMWQEYLGNSIKIGEHQFNSGQAFGFRPVFAGYNIAIPIKKFFDIDVMDGYTLLSMSRPISLREARGICPVLSSVKKD